jgi:hypothetical protein
LAFYLGSDCYRNSFSRHKRWMLTRRFLTNI